MKKKNEEKQQKILKILKIIGCSLGLLLCGGAFISLLIIGVRGCVSQNNKKVVNETTLTTNHISKNPYKSIENNTSYINDVLFYAYSSSVEDMINEYDVSGHIGVAGQITYNNEAFTFNDITISCGDVNNIFVVNIRQYSTSDNTYFTFRAGLNGDGDYILSYVKSDVFNFASYYPRFENMPLLNTINIKFYSGSWQTSPYFTYFDNWFNFFFSPVNDNNLLEEPLNISFNSVINPFGVFGGSFDYFTTQHYQGEYYVFKGLFKDSQNVYYDRIAVLYDYGVRDLYGDATNYNEYNGNGSHYVGLAYYPVLNPQQMLVNKQDYVTATAGNNIGGSVLCLSNHWVSSLFQNITIYSIDFDFNYPIGNEYSPIERLTALNSTGNTSGLTGTGGSVGTISVFTLIGNAFKSLIPIFNTYILPGVNLWTLLIIPLVGSMVLFIVWLFKR